MIIEENMEMEEEIRSNAKINITEYRWHKNNGYV